MVAGLALATGCGGAPVITPMWTTPPRRDRAAAFHRHPAAQRHRGLPTFLPSPSPTVTSTPLPILTLVPSVTPTETPPNRPFYLIPILEYHYSDFSNDQPVINTGHQVTAGQEIQWLTQNSFTTLGAPRTWIFVREAEPLPVKSVVQLFI